MKQELQDLAISSTLNTLSQLGINLTKTEAHNLATNPIVHIQIEFVGDVNGYIILETTPKFSCDLANIMLQGMMTVNDVDDMCKSVLGELCNMISGNLSSNISALGISTDIKPPIVDIREKPLDAKHASTLHKGPSSDFINTYFLITKYAVK